MLSTVKSSVQTLVQTSQMTAQNHWEMGQVELYITIRFHFFCSFVVDLLDIETCCWHSRDGGTFIILPWLTAILFIVCEAVHVHPLCCQETEALACKTQGGGVENTGGTGGILYQYTERIVGRIS